MGIRVLGPTSVDGAELTGRDRRVLAALVVADGRAVTAERVADALYGGDPPPTWRKVVQNSIVRIRRALGAHAIVTTTDGYQLVVGDDEIDLRRGERLIGLGRSLVADGEHDRAGVVLGEALGLFTGEPLADLEGWDAGRAEAARVHALRLDAEELLLDALLGAGRDREAATWAAALAEQEPLREQRWAALALAQYRAGRQGDALRSINRARRLLADELGLELGADLVHLERAILVQDVSLGSPVSAVTARSTCPYKGLAAYAIDDADDFFGREAAVADCLGRIARTGALVIVGASGCGKSSLARAGVAPALRSAGRDVVAMVPGSRPLDALAAIPASAVVVVDQLEELFTLCGDPSARGDFAAALERRALTTPVVATLRADHLGSVADVPALAALVERSVHLLAPMTEGEVAAVVAGPAQRSGLRLEGGLPELIERDVRGQPGALPLLSHALATTWEAREGRTLTVAGYQAAGGVHGAVAKTADRVVDGLPPEGRRIARRLFLRLVTLDAAGQPTRQRLTAADIASDPSSTAVLDALVQARLVTIDADSVEVAHEALASAWPRLRSWLDEDREGQRTLLHLSTAAAEWRAMGADDAELYRGARLRAAEEWLTTGPTLTATERTFLDASIDRRRLEEQELVERASAQARSNRRLRRMLAATGVLLVVAVVAGGLAVVRTGQASDERDRATATARESSLRALIDSSVAQRSTKRDLAALLAVAAYRAEPRTDTVGALLSTFTGAPGYMGTVTMPGGEAFVGMLLPDGTSYAGVDRTMAVHLVDITTGADLGSLPALHESTDGDVVLDASPDGRYLALGTGGPSDPNLLTVWDLDTRARRFPDQQLEFPPAAVSFSPDGELVAVSGGADARVQVRAAADGALVREVPSVPRPAGAALLLYTAAVRFLPDGNLAIGSQAGDVRIVEPRSGAEQRRLAGPRESSEIQLVVDRAGGNLYSTGALGTFAWNLQSGESRWSAPAPGGCNQIAVSEITDAVLCARSDTRVLTFDLATGVVLPARYDYQLGVVNAISIGDDGRLLIEGGGRSLGLWRLDGSGPVTRRIADGTRLRPSEIDSSGRVLVGTLTTGFGVDTDPDLIDAETGELLDPLPHVVAATLTDRTDRLAAILDDGAGAFYDLEAGERIPGITIDFPFVPIGATRAGGVLVLAGQHDLQGIDLHTGDLMPPSVHEVDTIFGVFLDPSGRYLVTHENDGIQRRTMTGAPVGPPLTAATVAVGTDALVLGTDDGHIRVFDPATAEPRGELPSVAGPVSVLVLSADGSRLLVVGRDRTVRLIDMAASEVIGEPIDMGAGGDALATLGPDGTLLAFGDATGVLVWDLDPEHLVAAACQVAGRNLTRAEWDAEVVGLGPYRTLCPDQPAAPS